MAPKNKTLERFMRLFKGRENAHGEYRKHQNRDNATLSGGPTENLFKQHLAGTGVVLGVIPITLDNVCYFGAIDLDDDTTNHAALASVVEHSGLPLVVCRSKSGGAHLYLFLKDPAPAKLVRNKLTSWAKSLGLQNPPERPGAKPRPVEIFPKAGEYADDDRGNWINIPYFDAKQTIRFAVLADGSELDLEQFLSRAEEMATTSFELEAMEAQKGQFEDGPPCLAALDETGYPESSRNMGLFALAIYFKAKFPQTWEEELHKYQGDKMDPPLKKKEVEATIKSVGAREYQYKCDELPIQPHCAKTECKKREFGIGMWRTKKVKAELPGIGNLRKITTDPPRWILEVDTQDVELTTDDLMLMPRFRRAVMEKCNRVFPQLKHAEWDDVLANLFTQLTVIEAPEDAGVNGQFRQLLGEFLIRRRSAVRKEDLLSGLPFQPEDSVKVYFRGMDLYNFLIRKNFREYNQSKLFTALRDVGAGHEQMNVQKQCLQVWYVPAPENEQTEEYHVAVEKDEF